MIKTTLSIDDSGLGSTFRSMTTSQKRRALEDAAQIIINSTKVGYQREISPEGVPWVKNPMWYKEMKGGAATLTGPTGTTVYGGRYGGRYTFANISLKRMKNSLMRTIDMFEESATVEYEREARDRAALTQEGGEGRIMLNSIGGSRSLTLNVRIQARPHLGIADHFPRLGIRTDPEHIANVFSQMVDEHIEG